MYLLICAEAILQPTSLEKSREMQVDEVVQAQICSGLVEEIGSQTLEP